MSQDLIFTFAHPEFYESLSHYSATAEYETRVRELVPAEWEVHRKSIWLHASNPAVQLPRQGFKIHVSSIHKYALSVLGAVIPECVDRGVSFKLAGDPSLHALLNSKPYDRGGAGKFMTLYPTDNDAFIDLIEALHRRTAESPFVGPYILCDRRYADSKILFYRYGGIVPIEHLTVDGTKYAPLVAPDGTMVPDQRLPYFKLPNWIEDPFGGSQEVEGEDATMLAGRFTVEGMITASNRGGVYNGTDTTTGMPVVIKEARPHVNRMWKKGTAVDGMDFLENEYRILQRLEHLGCTPKPVAVFKEWEHLFLVQERIEGMGLKRFLAQIENIMLPYILRDGVLERFIPKFRILAEQLIDAVERIHSLGIVLGDLSVNNVIVHPESLQLTLIDLESATSVVEDDDFMQFAQHWYTPGFARDGRGNQSLSFDDDYFAIGMIVYNLFLAGLEFFYLKPEGKHLFLDELVGLGVPVAARETIEHLLAGRVVDAKRALSVL